MGKDWIEQAAFDFPGLKVVKEELDLVYKMRLIDRVDGQNLYPMADGIKNKIAKAYS